MSSIPIDLSSAAFRAAFYRFTGRRGLPFRIYSENDWNFVGASRLLKRGSFIKSASVGIAQKYITHGQTDIHPTTCTLLGLLWEGEFPISFKKS